MLSLPKHFARIVERLNYCPTARCFGKLSITDGLILNFL